MEVRYHVGTNLGVFCYAGLFKIEAFEISPHSQRQGHPVSITVRFAVLEPYAAGYGLWRMSAQVVCCAGYIAVCAHMLSK